MNPQDLAALMLGAGKNAGTALHRGLYDAIDRAEFLARNAGGDIRSRQVVAAIIVAWELANPNEEALPG